MRLKSLLPCILLLVMLGGCAANNTPQTPDGNIEYPPADRSGIIVTYLCTPSQAVPIAVSEDGNSRLTGDIYYYNLQAALNADERVSDRQYTRFDCDGKRLGVSSAQDAAKASSKYCELITGGNWMLCPTVRHLSSDSKNAPTDNGYCEFIHSSFPDKFGSAQDVFVTDMWEYDIDGDGANEAIIRAAGEGYYVLALQSQSLGNRILASAFGDSSFSAQPFIADTDGDGSFSLIVVSGNSFKRVNVYAKNCADIEYTVYLPLEK